MKLTLKAARVNAGLKQIELAQAVNVTKKTVGSWENGKAVPRADKIDAICQTLGVSYDMIKWTN